MIYINKAIIQDEYAHGTKVFVYPTSDDSDKLFKFVSSLGINGDLVKAHQYHCTVIYSDSACPGAEHHPVKLPLMGSIYGYTVFGGPAGKCLVGLLHSPDIRNLNNDIVSSYGATSRFPTFIPHITLAWKFDGDIPETVTNDMITFDAYKVGGIDPNWTPQQLLDE